MVEEKPKDEPKKPRKKPSEYEEIDSLEPAELEDGT